MADKTITQKVCVAANVDRLAIESTITGLRLFVTYHVSDSNGAQIGNQRAIEVALSAGNLTTLSNFISNVVLPAVNQAEGT